MPTIQNDSDLGKITAYMNTGQITTSKIPQEQVQDLVPSLHELKISQTDHKIKLEHLQTETDLSIRQIKIDHTTLRTEHICLENRVIQLETQLSRLRMFVVSLTILFVIFAVTIGILWP